MIEPVVLTENLIHLPSITSRCSFSDEMEFEFNVPPLIIDFSFILTYYDIGLNNIELDYFSLYI